jgi:hypothetical protein
MESEYVRATKNTTISSDWILFAAQKFQQVVLGREPMAPGLNIVSRISRGLNKFLTPGSSHKFVDVVDRRFENQ